MRWRIALLKRKWILSTGVLFFLVFVVWLVSLPTDLFQEPYSTVLEDKHGQLLSASIAKDGQWRFPSGKELPDKYVSALIAYEDKRFESHPGVDILSTARAIRQNIRARRVVSGGSTITMQVIRLARKETSRSFLEKVIEMFLATRLEARLRKEEILRLYASHAPFGGNVVGIEAACWRYFGRGVEELSWAEAALLAVLPNNPSLIHPGKNRERLIVKRDALLRQLYAYGKLDRTSLKLAIAEPIPSNPQSLPHHAHHLLDRIAREGYSQTRLSSTLDQSLQLQAENVLADHHQRLKGNQIFNAAAVIVEVKTGNVLAYVGNTEAGDAYQSQVDVVTAPRSTGSILKPFLFAAMLNEGKMLSSTLLPDIPTVINGFSPKNFSHQYDGAVPADKALIRSLNIPMVHALRDFRYEKFYSILQNTGITSLTKFPDHYGLSLILGGAEASLWDITGAYASMARTLTNFSEHTGTARYKTENFHPLHYDKILISKTSADGDTHQVFSAASIWLTLDVLKELYRPGEETGWRNFNSSKKIAWKTGTSFGFRDGWAVGVNPDYAVGVWVGNADGEGRPGLTGTETAAPLMFDLFALLPGQSWFQQPFAEMVRIPVCAQSGQRASDVCPNAPIKWISRTGLTSQACTYHKLVHLTGDGNFRVHSGCESIDKMIIKPWFVLPPAEEYFYKSINLSYRTLPPFRKDCPDPSNIMGMELGYPKPNARIYIPHNLDGTLSSIVFEAAHRTPGSSLYWHLDGTFVGKTTGLHRIALAPSKGEHRITVVDEAGETIERAFTVLSSP